jgi:hypothetical protein
VILPSPRMYVHLPNVLSKLGVTPRAQLIALALPEQRASSSTPRGRTCRQLACTVNGTVMTCPSPSRNCAHSW